MATTFVNTISRAVGTTEVEAFSAVDKSIVIGCSITNLLSTTVPITIKMALPILYFHTHVL